MRVTLRNDFHNTEVTLKTEVFTQTNNITTIYLSESQTKRAKRVLCGTSGCTCSNAFGTRGIQTVDGKRLAIV